MEEQIIVGVLKLTVLLATPYILTGIGELISERAGILNISLEGYLYFSAFTSYVVSVFTGDCFLGLLTGMASGLFLSLINAFFSIDVKTSQIITGIALNIFATGLTGAWYKLLFGEKPPKPIIGYKDFALPYLVDVPILGKIIFNQPLYVYVWMLLVPIIYYLFYKTKTGLIIRASGEDPLVVKSIGVNVRIVQYSANLMCGALSGLAGSFLSLCYLSYFIHGITAGRGFIVLALVIAGGWDPVKILIVSLVYGFVESLQLSLQISGVAVPYPFLMMLPYLLTIIILILKKEEMPQSLGMPPKEE